MVCCSMGGGGAVAVRAVGGSVTRRAWAAADGSSCSTTVFFDFFFLLGSLLGCLAAKREAPTTNPVDFRFRGVASPPAAVGRTAVVVLVGLANPGWRRMAAGLLRGDVLGVGDEGVVAVAAFAGFLFLVVDESLAVAVVVAVVESATACPT